MKTEKVVLGVVGGMGSYASLDFYRRFLDSFPAERDWERPRILIDNYSTLPSRVRAILYKENIDELVEKLYESIMNLRLTGATDIVLACHTSHYFLDEIKKKCEGNLPNILNLIELAKEQCLLQNIHKVKLLASEGTIQGEIYQKVFQDDIMILNPDKKELTDIRALIESVKQNKITEYELVNFCSMINESEFPVILGCSELPVLYHRCIIEKKCFQNDVIDPLQSVLDYIIKNMDEVIVEK